jgi:hypothetical protein
MIEVEESVFPMNVSSGKWPMTCGVYLIREKSTGRVNVGITGRTFRWRWDAHRRELRGARHGNYLLQEAYFCSGEAAFEFQVLEILAQTNVVHSAARENYWIQRLKSRVEEGGFNLQDGEGYAKWSEEARLAQKRAAIKRWGSRYRFKTPQGGEIQIDDMEEYCAREGLSSSAMRQVFRGKMLSYKGYTAIGSSFVPMRCRNYTFVSPTGSEHTTSSIKELATEFGLNRAALSSVVYGDYKHHHGWTIKRAYTTKRRFNKRRASIRTAQETKR